MRVRYPNIVTGHLQSELYDCMALVRDHCRRTFVLLDEWPQCVELGFFVRLAVRRYMDKHFRGTEEATAEGAAHHFGIKASTIIGWNQRYRKRADAA